MFGREKIKEENFNVQSNEINYFEAIDTLDTNVFIANKNYEIIYVNRKAQDVMDDISSQVKDSFGVDTNQLVGTNIDVFHADRKEEIRKKLKDPNSFPIRAEIGFSGLILDLQIMPMQDGSDTTGFIVNWEEISEKKSIADKAAKSLNLIENAPLNILVADLDGNINLINPRSLETLKSIEHLLPVKADEILGKSYDIFHKDPSHQRTILGDPANLPQRTQILLGDEILDLFVAPVYDAEGNYSGPMVTWDVVTETVRMENQMASNNQMLDESPVNIMRADMDFKITYLNAKSKATFLKLAEYLPIESDKILGSSIDIFHENPEKQREILKDPKNLPVVADIELGPEKLKLNVNALYDKLGNYVGPMVIWDVVTDKYRIIESLNEASLKLSAAAEQLNVSSDQMILNAENTTNQANTAATASEEIAAGVTNVASSMDEMTGSIREITGKTNEASNKSSEAQQTVAKTNDTITMLGKSSSEIGNVIKVISSIAKQTNLLALNATIEAARAGEAGKGFAVVANEVKELAKETADATSDITNKIESIQSDSTLAVSAIGGVMGSIEALDEISTNIAASIEEQAATTNEVARIASEATAATNEITINVTEVVKMSGATLQAAKEAKDASTNLNELAQTLRDLVEKVEV
ncbi:MAG: methyl-accepting chemotaxis protein [Bdellovibrionales bacterium]